MNENTAYWKRAHHDWRFWVGVVCVVIAMLVFVMTDNLLFRPGIQRQATPSSALR